MKLPSLSQSTLNSSKTKTISSFSTSAKEAIKKSAKPVLIIGAITSLLTIIISLLIGEYIIRHTMPQNTYNFARQRGMHIFDNGKNIPITLQKNVKNFHHIGYTLEFDHYINTNSFGIRGPEITPDKPENTYRILLLGDSMTFGWGVNDNETFAQFTQDNLNKWAKETDKDLNFEVINAGFTDGKTLDSYLVFLKETGLQLKPDLVVLNFFPFNDILDLSEMKWDLTDKNGLPQKITSKTQTIEDGYIVNTYKKTGCSKYLSPETHTWAFSL